MTQLAVRHVCLAKRDFVSDDLVLSRPSVLSCFSGLNLSVSTCFCFKFLLVCRPVRFWAWGFSNRLRFLNEVSLEAAVVWCLLDYDTHVIRLDYTKFFKICFQVSERLGHRWVPLPNESLHPAITSEGADAETFYLDILQSDQDKQLD